MSRYQAQIYNEDVEERKMIIIIIIFINYYYNYF
jgi:hypothetical protein